MQPMQECVYETTPPSSLSSNPVATTRACVVGKVNTVMKWLVLACLIWARHGEGGALKCVTESEDAPCPSENQAIELQNIPLQCVTESEGAPCPIVQAIEPQNIEAETPSSSIEEPLEAECLPGSEWESNCHSCRCSPEGAAECRRQSSCDSPYTDPIRCKPNTTFERECNTCTCLEDGRGLCTLMICQKIPARAPSKEALPMGQDCAPGSEWKSGCNDCVCSPEGLRLCSSLGCPEGQEAEPLLRCAPHSLWKKECNTCWCTSDGRAMCTRIGCVGIPGDMNFGGDEDEPDSLEVVQQNETLPRKVRAVQQEPPKACRPGQEFRMDCNKCLCDNEGQDFSCTRIDCNALNNNNNGGTRRKRDLSHKVPADCVPGSVFDRGCNVCRCTEDGGHATCTLKRCHNKEDNKVSTTESSFRCNPGEQFKQSCNDCSCSADGRSVFCTLFICDEDLTP